MKNARNEFSVKSDRDLLWFLKKYAKNAQNRILKAAAFDFDTKLGFRPKLAQFSPKLPRFRPKLFWFSPEPPGLGLNSPGLALNSPGLGLNSSGLALNPPV